MNTIESKTDVKWYIVRTQANREKSVSQKLIKESEKGGDLMNKIKQVIVPVEKTLVLKNGKKVTRDKVLYPGYVFVETNAIGELAYFVKGCDGATSLLSDKSGNVQSLHSSEVKRMIGQLDEQAAQKEEDVKNTFLVGEEVKIIDGAFDSFCGKVEAVSDTKIKVAVLIFGRETLLDLNPMQIVKNY